MQGVSIELCDQQGRKVRVLVTGHWDDLVRDVAGKVLNDVDYLLSDVEDVEP